MAKKKVKNKAGEYPPIKVKATSGVNDVALFEKYRYPPPHPTAVAIKAGKMGTDKKPLSPFYSVMITGTDKKTHTVENSPLVQQKVRAGILLVVQ